VLSTLWWALAALAVILSVRVLADRTAQSPAVLLVLAGLGISFLPLPSASLEPELIMDVIIPPLLFVAARDASLLGCARTCGSWRRSRSGSCWRPRWASRRGWR
jgi:CPA1 family monovalent cation:H+ antiporter